MAGVVGAGPVAAVCAGHDAEGGAEVGVMPQGFVLAHMPGALGVRTGPEHAPRSALDLKAGGAVVASAA